MKTVLMAIGRSVGQTEDQTEDVTSLPFERERTEVHVCYISPPSRERDALMSISAVDTALEGLESAGFETAVSAAQDDTAEAILARANELQADAISLGNRNRTPTGKALFGSVTQRVIRESDCPVIVSSPSA